MRILDEYLIARVENEVGIEIEMEGIDLTRFRSQYWSAKTEYSLRGDNEQIEYVSKPFARKDVKNRINRFYSLLKNNGAIFEPSPRCGVHVHINCQQLTVQQVFVFICLYLVLEDLLIKWCGREGNLFCLRSQDAEGFLIALIDCKRNNSLNRVMHDVYRYSSINVRALKRFGTLEFRGLPTELTWERIPIWVEILLTIKDRSLQYEEPKNIVEDFSGRGGAGFIRDILGEKLYQIVSTPNENRMVLDGIRRIQDVAYVQQREDY
jgi:hypothetical protein